jgi:hypothetical protein
METPLMQQITVPEKGIMKIFETDNHCSSQLDAPTTAQNSERIANTCVWAIITLQIW